MSLCLCGVRAASMCARVVLSYFKPLVQWSVRHWLPMNWRRVCSRGSLPYASVAIVPYVARSFGTGMPPTRHSMGSRRDKAPPEAAAQRKARAPGGRLAVGASVALVAAAALQHLGRPPQTVDTVPRVEFWSVDSDRQREARTETAAAEVVQNVAAGRRPVVLTGSPVREWRAIRDGTWSPDRHRATLASQGFCYLALGVAWAATPLPGSHANLAYFYSCTGWAGGSACSQWSIRSPMARRSRTTTTAT